MPASPMPGREVDVLEVRNTLAPRPTQTSPKSQMSLLRHKRQPAFPLGVRSPQGQDQCAWEGPISELEILASRHCHA